MWKMIQIWEFYLHEMLIKWEAWFIYIPVWVLNKSFSTVGRLFISSLLLYIDPGISQPQACHYQHSLDDKHVCTTDFLRYMRQEFLTFLQHRYRCILNLAVLIFWVTEKRWHEYYDWGNMQSSAGTVPWAVHSLYELRWVEVILYSFMYLNVCA